MSSQLYEFYPQRSVCFVDFLANPSEQTYFFNGLSLTLITFGLLFLCFLNFVFSSSTANMLQYQVYLMVLGTQQLCLLIDLAMRFRLGCERKLALLAAQMEQCLKNFGLKFKWFYIMAATHLSKCPGGHPVLHLGLKLNSKILGGKD